MNTIRQTAMAIVLGVGIPALAACADSADAPAQTANGLTVSNARVVLAPVAGNPAAVYFDLAYSGANAVTLDSVTVEGAGMAMIHDYAETAGKMQMTMADAVPLSADAPVMFAPGGLHVMAMEPTAALTAGGTAKVTLRLSDGTTVTIDAPVRAAGEDR